jgi:hypothetical protein
MKQTMESKFPIFQGAVKKINERRERKNMKHCFTWIGLICLVMFSVNADATTPFADDLPDLRLAPQGSSSFPKSLDPAFDLDDYVIDNNQSDDVLSWSSVVETNGPVVNIDGSSAQPALHAVEYMENAQGGLFDVTYTVDDQVDGTDSTVSTVKYSTFFVTEPKFTADNRLSFKGPNKPRFTYVKLSSADGGSAETTPSLLPYLVSDLGTGAAFTPPTAFHFGPLLAYDLSTGAPVKVAEGNSIDILGALDAQVLTPSGVVYLTPKNALSCAVLISIPAVLDTFDDSGDWDGTVIMVAPAKRITTYPAQVGIFGANPQLIVNTRFENIPAGAALQPGGAGVSGNARFISAGWRLNSTGSLPTGTVSILTPAQLAATDAGNAANQFAGATSGNCLELLCNNASGTQVMISTLNTFDITPALPGEVYGISMNIATDIPASQAANIQRNVQVALKTQTKPDGNYTAASLLNDQGTAGLGTMALPVDGKWRQVYTQFTVPKVSQEVDGLYNMMPNGFLVNIVVAVRPGTPQFRLFIDNVYIYCKGMSDINVNDVNGEAGGLVENGLANGVTAIPAVYNRVDPEVNPLIDMAFESGSDLADNNWVNTGKPGNVLTAWYTGDHTVEIEPTGRLQSSGSMAVQLAHATDPTRNNGVRFRTKGIALNGRKDDATIIAGAPDYTGESYWGLTFWLASAAADITQNPELKVVLQEIRPALNQLFNTVTLGPAAIPTVDQGWVQYSIVGAYPELGLGKAMQAALVECNVVNIGGRQSFITPAPYDGTTNGKPGSVGTARIFVDDFVIHKVRDLDTFWNASLFE